MKKRARAFLDQRETARKNVFADLRHERAPRVFDRLPVLGLASRQFRQIFRRARRRCKRGLMREFDERRFASDEVGLGTDFDQRRARFARANRDRAFRRRAPRDCVGARAAFDAQGLPRRVQIAVRRDERFFALHHPKPGLLAQGLDCGGGDLRHNDSPFSPFSPLTAESSTASPSATASLTSSMRAALPRIIAFAISRRYKSVACFESSLPGMT